MASSPVVAMASATAVPVASHRRAAAAAAAASSASRRGALGARDRHARWITTSVATTFRGRTIDRSRSSVGTDASRADRLARLRTRAASAEPPATEATTSTTAIELSVDECDDEDNCAVSFFEVGADGRLAEPLEAAIPGDYYSLLQIDLDADETEVKAQYRQLQKWCHPDIAGEAGTEVCVILNEAYDTLMDEKQREVYDRDLTELRRAQNLAGDDGDFKPYTGQPLSKFVGSDPVETGKDARAVFVNESACIGCRQCNHSAPKTFMMEDDWGRARAYQQVRAIRFDASPRPVPDLDRARTNERTLTLPLTLTLIPLPHPDDRSQWADTEEDITIAIESCPVDCIYWVKQRNLPILEYAMQRCERQNVGVMNGGNVRVGDPFDVANSMIRKGEEARARLGMDPSTAMEGAATTGKMQVRSLHWFPYDRVGVVNADP